MTSGRLKEQIIATNMLQNSGNTTGLNSRVPEGFDGNGPHDGSLIRISESAMNRTVMMADNLLTFTSIYQNSTSRAQFNLIRTGEIFELPDNPWLSPNNISSHLETIATAIATNIRNQDNTLDFATGPAIIHLVLVDVRWKWLSLLQNGLGDDVQKALGLETNIGNVRKKAGRIDTVLG